MVTGEVGAGKTIAARAAVAALDASRYTVVYLSNPMVGARGIHHHLVVALGDIPKFHRPALIAQTADLLAAETEERRKTVVLIVDEAHLLSAEQLEQLRLLTNTDMDSAQPARPDPARTTHPAPAAQTRPLRRARPAHRPAVPPRRPARSRRPPPTSPTTSPSPADPTRCSPTTPSH